MYYYIFSNYSAVIELNKNHGDTACPDVSGERARRTTTCPDLSGEAIIKNV